MSFIAQNNNDFKEVEDKWRHNWANKKVFEANPEEKDKIFVNFPFPYVNGPLHLGHAFTLTRLDVFARFKRMQGFNVLFPMAFHATGEPIIGVAKRLEKGDEAQKRILLNEGLTEDDLGKFQDPKYIARFWQKRIIKDVNMIGGSIDWRRSFMTIDPIFNKFIEWQYRRLKEKGYVIQGTHPVVWCRNCQSPTGDHDRLKGEGEGPQDFMWAKFKMKDSDLILMAGTTRPDALLGQANLWIDRNGEYIIVKVGNEKWVVGKAVLNKIEDQYKKAEVIGKIEPKELIGKWFKGPVVDWELYSLPAWFIDSSVGSGIVYSALEDPVDLFQLKKIQSNLDLIREFDMDIETVKKLKPIYIIDVPGMGENLGEDIGREFGVTSIEEKGKLAKAKSELNKRVFRKGVMNKNCGKYAGMTVPDAQEVLKKELAKSKDAVMFYELTDEVVCRCGTPCGVKVLENQWFLKFSDEEWKDKVRLCINNMNIYPEEGRKLFLDTVDWLKDKACARRSGLGTRVPWDKDWIIETLSDSVIYMAFYTIRNYLDDVEPDQLEDEMFDYIYFGKGDVTGISKNTSISKEKIQKMREEFEYWYGFDLRGSAKELVPNHLTYSLFHHTAIWDDQKYWPRAITVNGMQQMNGQKMSKSKGNFITLKNAVEKYSADAIRITLMDSGEGISDPDWTEVQTLAWKRKLKSIKRMVEDHYGKLESKEKAFIDTWLESRFENHMKKMTEAMEKTENRTSVSIIHDFFNDLQWYMRRGGKNKESFDSSVEKLIKSLTPFSPFISEEIWSFMGKDGFISFSEWPKVDESSINEEILQLEDSFKKTCEDLKEVIKLSGKNEDLYLYVLSDKEFDYFSQGKDFILNDFSFKKVEILRVNDEKKYDPEEKAKRAKFGKPGIFVE